jgi:hypothetical protein
MEHRGAQSQASVRADFRTALEPHGRWQHHARFGDVWVPANRSRDWRPYTAGRWVYTNDWGWYWESDDSEAHWGWIAYHYGRWASDDELGWYWVPGEEWSPAWVQWRRPREDVEYVGWAALPPDEVAVDYVDSPRFWCFVRGGDFIAPRLASVILPVARYDVFFRETVVVNRTVLVNERERFAVNPGISPSFIAAATQQPVRTFDVRPTVLAGTAAIAGATQVRSQDLRAGGFQPRTSLQPTQSMVRAADRVTPAQPLAAGERGRLGDQPPRAAQRGPQAPSTTGRAPADTGQPALPPQQAQPKQLPQQQAQPKLPQQQAQPKQLPQQQAQPKQLPQQQAQPKQLPQQQAQPKQLPQQQAQPKQPQQPATTEGRNPVERRQQAQPSPQREQRTAQPPQRPATTEGRNAAEQRQQRGATEGRGAVQAPQRAAPQVERRAPAQQAPMTQGRSGAGGAPHASPAAPHMQGGGGATEGRGGAGGGGAPRAPAGAAGGGGHSPGGLR